MAKQILIATTNPGKIYEYKYVLQHIYKKPIEFLFLDQKHNIPEPEETGLTYEENALIKAAYYFQHFNIPAISDDSGMEIEVLDKVPGVHTARFIKKHKDKTFETLEKMILDKSPKDQNKKASFHCCTIYKDNNSKLVSNSYTEGLFTFPPRGKSTKSFGYDPIFELTDIKKTLAEIDTDTKLIYSPRVKAFKQLLEKLGY